VLLDRIDARAEDDRVLVDVHTTLRTAALANHNSRPELSAAETDALVRSAAPYLASHLDIGLEGRSLDATVVSTSIDEPIEAGVGEQDLERLHSVTRLSYALPRHDSDLTLTFSSRVLEEVEGWDEAFAVVLSTDASHTSSGVLHRNKPLTLHVSRTQALQPKSSSAWSWVIAATMAIAMIVAAWRLQAGLRK
jgi:hypothetical protein